MSIDGVFVLAALLASFVAVYRSWLSADIALMAGLSAVAIGGIVEPVEAVSGFASTAVIAVASLYVVVAGLLRAGWPGELVPASIRDRLLRYADDLGIGSTLRSFAEATRRRGRGPGARRFVGYAAALGVVVLPLTGLARVEAAALLGAAAVVVSGLLTAEDARRAIDWEIVVVVGAVIGFSRALVATGVVDVFGRALAQLEAVSASPLAVALGLTTTVVIAALTNRRAAASILPLVLSVGLLLEPAALL